MPISERNTLLRSRHRAKRRLDLVLARRAPGDHLRPNCSGRVMRIAGGTVRSIS
jgi:hypothetical protein